MRYKLISSNNPQRMMRVNGQRNFLANHFAKKQKDRTDLINFLGILSMVLFFGGALFFRGF